jgi:hypothetical protein
VPTPLGDAAKKGRLDMVKFLVENGARNFNTAVVTASENGNVEVVKYLVDQGVEHVFTPHEKKWLSFCEKVENKRRVKAVNTIGSWWIPFCYDLNRECGRRMMERSWKRVEALYECGVNG